MFGIPVIKMYDRVWFETPEKAEEWIKEHPKCKILATYKEGSEGFKSHKFDEATQRNCSYEQYKAVVIYNWRP